MSVYAVERLKQIMDLAINQALSQLILNTSLTEQVESWLEDEASRDAYRRELVFMVLRGILKDDMATVAHAGNISPQKWQEALNQAGAMRRSGEIPALEYPPSPDWMLPYLNASTFVLEQYRHKDEVAVRPGDVFLDCGGCGGETAVWAARCGAGRVYSFEPDPACLPYLRRNLDIHAPGVAEAVPLALSDAPGTMEIVSYAHTGGARLAAEGSGGAKAEVVTLDGWCEKNGVRPDFIKMDLEGAEPAALRGARRIISDYKPRLAISLYHALSDMWVIPSLIKEICPDYRFWCRKNSLLVEFVLYGSAQANVA